MATNKSYGYNEQAVPDAQGMQFGLVVSKWNANITKNLHKGALQILEKHKAKSVITWEVPGSFELIYGAKKMSQLEKKVDAIIAIGCLIQGETQHFEYVSQAVAQGIKDLNVRQHIPVIFCVLTDQNVQQSIARSGGDLGNKGVEAAIAAIEMAHIKRTLE